ncbi:MAG: glycosyltransferase family 2 protein [Planctomycetota bacterium]
MTRLYQLLRWLVGEEMLDRLSSSRLFSSIASLVHRQPTSAATHESVGNTTVNTRSGQNHKRSPTPQASSSHLPPEVRDLLVAFSTGDEKPTAGGLASLFLSAAHEVRPTGDSDYDWLSEGTDPYFHLHQDFTELRAGWHLFEVCIRSDISGVAKLYCDDGAGWSETKAVALPWKIGQPVRRVYHLLSAPQQLRFDPLEAVGRFSVERLSIVALTPLQASLEMLWRLDETGTLAPSADRLRDNQPAALYHRYNKTFQNWILGSFEYQDWIDTTETTETPPRGVLLAEQASFHHLPVFSIILPTYNTPELFLRQAIESVRAQIYAHWELCIADDASTQPHVRTVLQEYARHDPRIKINFRQANGHISAASNSALELATGEYIVLMDHDDLLPIHALHYVAQAIDRHPTAQVLYSDEDKVDEHGNRMDPYFKPDWNPDLFFSNNYVSHLGVFRRNLLQRIGGFRRGVEGSQDYDLLLRCLPSIGPDEIVHIPKVLYHWRTVSGSTALASGQKSYTTQAGIQALQDFFAGQGSSVTAVEAGPMPDTYRIRYPISLPEPLVSLLVPTRDRLDLLERCVGSILSKTTYRNFEIIILDNESTLPATHAYLTRIQADDPRVKVLPFPFPFNYSAINNFGVRHAQGELIGLINNDTEVITPDWLSEMASHALRLDIGCVGAKLYYEDDSIQHAGVVVGLGGVAGHGHINWPGNSFGYCRRLCLTQNYSAVTAACLLVRKAVYQQVGGLDEDNLQVAFNDVDFCLKVSGAGYRNLWTPYAELYHHESQTRGADDSPEKKARFDSEKAYMQARWGARLSRDPYYSPNLTQDHCDFSFRTHR